MHITSNNKQKNNQNSVSFMKNCDFLIFLKTKIAVITDTAKITNLKLTDIYITPF